jgi:hypothetical protein
VSEVGGSRLANGPTPADAVRHAEDLARTDWAAALAELESTNRGGRSDEVEIAIAALRHRGYAALASTPRYPSPAATPTAPETGPRVGASGLPEASLAGLGAGAVRAAVLEHGCLLVKGALDAGRAADIAGAIDHAFDAQDSAETSSAPTPVAPSAWWYPLEVEGAAAASLGRKWVRGGGGVLLADSPRFMFEILDLYTALGLRSIVSDYLGSRPVLSANKCTLRRVSVKTNGDWHQDGAFLGSGIRAINMWLTLTPCGVEAPGLDLVPRRFDSIVETGTGGAYFDWAVGPEVVKRVSADVGVVRPQFDAGDLLIFDDLFLHRTAIEPEMTRERHAIEMWCFAADAYPSGQVPLVW